MAPHDTPEDKHGKPIEVGDLVDFVYGGDHHQEPVTETGLSTHGVPLVAVTTTLTVPAGAVKVIKKATKKHTRQPNSSEKGTQP